MRCANWFAMCSLMGSDAAAQIHQVLPSPTPDGCGEIAWHQFAVHTLNRVYFWPAMYHCTPIPVIYHPVTPPCRSTAPFALDSVLACWRWRDGWLVQGRDTTVAKARHSCGVQAAVWLSQDVVRTSVWLTVCCFSNLVRVRQCWAVQHEVVERKARCAP